MVNSRNRGKLVLLETHKTALEASYTFNISEDFTKISKLILVWNISCTLALNLELVINGIVNYNTDGRHITAGTETLLTSTGDSEIEIDNTSNLSGVDALSSGTAEIYLTKIGTTRPTVISQAHGMAQTYLREASCIGTETSITSVKIQASTSTFQAGTYVSLYKVLS